MRRTGTFAVAALAVALGLAACSGGGGHRMKEVQPVGSVGRGEGALTLVAWNGYTEYGSSDSRVDWISPFEKKTKCKVTVKYAADTHDMVSTMASHRTHYDGVVAPPEVAGQLIADKLVAPVNTALVEGYTSLQPKLRSQLTVKDKHYGVPFAWGANILMYDPNAVHAAPNSLRAIFDAEKAKSYAGRLVLRNSPLTFGDVALYLRAHNPKLHIKDPYALTTKQLDAAAQLISKEHKYVKTYWRQAADVVNAFASEGAALGQAWPHDLDVLSQAGRSVAMATPQEGVTGWTDAWMIGAQAEHPNCMYQWLDWAISPKVQQQVAQWDGVAPANPEACGKNRLSSRFCDSYHVTDRAYINSIIFARTPTADCGTGKSGCTDFLDWSRAWENARR